MTTDSIEWRVVGCAPAYEVSNDGRLRRGSREIKGYRLRNGYIGCSVSQDGGRRSTTIHALVAEAFIPNPGGKPEVNHKNGVKDDNRASNLEWVTHSENLRHSYDVLGNKGRPRTRPIHDPTPQELSRIEIHDATTGEDFHIVVVSGTRPGNLRVMVNGEHWPKLDTTTELMAWLRRRLPRTSPKRAIPE